MSRPVKTNQDFTFSMSLCNIIICQYESIVKTYIYGMLNKIAAEDCEKMLTACSVSGDEKLYTLEYLMTKSSVSMTH